MYMIIMLSAYAHSAYAGSSLLVLLKGSFTTNTRIFYNTDNPQAFSEISNVSSNYGIGAEVRIRTFWERWVLGIAVEKISGSFERTSVYLGPTGRIFVPRSDGYELLPVEVSAFYVVPISSNTFEFYLGGGVGYYTGKRKYSVGSAASRSTDVHSVMGIHVSTGIRWTFTSLLALDAHMRFRDPQINAVNQFGERSTVIGGVTVPLVQGPMHTQINLNGINYSAGLAIVF